MMANAWRLRLKAGDHLPRVHARLENLECDLASDWLGLFAHENDAEAPFADLFEELIWSNNRARRCPGRLCSGILFSKVRLEERAKLFLMPQEILNFAE